MNASKEIRVTHSAFRGLAAPWTSRAHMKYRGTASYQIVFQNNQPINENIELAWCEFTDDHDFAFLRYVKNLQFHHNFVDNFNDDGLECGPKLRDHTMFIYQNRIGACLIPLSQHENEQGRIAAGPRPASRRVRLSQRDRSARRDVQMPADSARPERRVPARGRPSLGDHGGPI